MIRTELADRIAVGNLGGILQRGEIGSGAVALVEARLVKGCCGLALDEAAHALLPDGGRVSGAVQVRELLRLVIAYPDGNRIVRRHAAEPAVLTAIGGSGFSCRLHIAVPAHARRGTVRDDALHDVDHHIGTLALVHLTSFRILENVITGIIDQLHDTGGIMVLAMIRDRRVRAGHLLGRYTVGETAKRRGIVVVIRDDVVKPHLCEISQPEIRGQAVVDRRGDAVTAPLNRPAERHRIPGELAHTGSRHLRLTDIDIGDHAARGPAIFQRRRRHEQSRYRAQKRRSGNSAPGMHGRVSKN